MSIIGIGVDIVNNNRLKKLIKNKNFIEKIFTNYEQKNSQALRNKINYYSKRFAAKEAFSKATGLGISKNINFGPPFPLYFFDQKTYFCELCQNRILFNS